MEMEKITSAKIIAIANQKGGVGKTTTSVNFSASLAVAKHRVLLVDLDPQGNATGGSGVNKLTVAHSINEVLLGEIKAGEAIVSTEWNYDLIPANGNLTLAEVRLLSIEDRDKKLKLVLSEIRAHYDYILIDCPPSLNMLTVNALVAADGVMIPIQCEYYALEGLASLLNNVDRIRYTANPNLQLEGVVRTMYDGRNRLTTEVSEQLLSHLGDKLYQTVIPRNVRVAEAPSYGAPITSYDRTSLGAQAYLAFTDEFLQRQQAAMTLCTG